MEHLGPSWNILEHFGTSWNLLEHVGNSWNNLVWNVLEHSGTPREGCLGKWIIFNQSEWRCPPSERKWVTQGNSHKRENEKWVRLLLHFLLFSFFSFSHSSFCLSFHSPSFLNDILPSTNHTVISPLVVLVAFVRELVLIFFLRRKSRDLFLNTGFSPHHNTLVTLALLLQGGVCGIPASKTMEQSVEERLWDAARAGNEAEVRNILKENRDVNVNWRERGNEPCREMTALHVACDNGHDKVVSLLLAHPDIKVNQEDEEKKTPFQTTCLSGSTTCIHLLLNDSRVATTGLKGNGYLPLYNASWNGHIDVVKWWIASGREIDLGTGSMANAVYAAQMKCKKIAALLEKFLENRTQTRNEVMMELGILGECMT